MSTALPARAIERSTSILGALHQKREGMTLHELGAATGLDHWTLHKELKGMMQRQQVTREMLYGDHQHWTERRKSGQYRYRFTEEFGKLVVDLG